MTVDRISIAIWSSAMVFMGAVTASMIEKQLVDHWWQAHTVGAVPFISAEDFTTAEMLRSCRVEDTDGVIHVNVIMIPRLKKELERLK